MTKVSRVQRIAGALVAVIGFIGVTARPSSALIAWSAEWWGFITGKVFMLALLVIGARLAMGLRLTRRNKEQRSEVARKLNEVRWAGKKKKAAKKK
jgi:hypothetical protein